MKFDNDVSGKFDAFELRQALAYAGIHISRDITGLSQRSGHRLRIFSGIMVIRYAEADDDNSMKITLSDFVLMGTRLKNAIKKYRQIQVKLNFSEIWKSLLRVHDLNRPL